MIGQDTQLSADERAYRDRVIERLESDVFVDRLDRDHYEALDDNAETRADWETYVQRMADLDLAGIAVSESYNGAGGSYVETVLAEEAIGYVGTIVHACQTSLTQHIGQTLYQHGTDHLKDTYLAPMLDGDLIVSQAYTEPSSGTDLAHLGTTAERTDNGWSLSGEKRLVDFARYGDFYFVPARTSGDDGDRQGVSLFVVDADAAGIEIVADQSDWHGFRGTGAGWLRFDQTPVPVENLVGDEGAAWSYITDELTLEHLTVARYCLGASQRALELAVNYTDARTVNERPLSAYQGVSLDIADMATRLDAAYLLNTRCARLLDAEGLDAGRMESAMAKWYGNDLAHEIADTCMQLVGGIGTTPLYPIERTQRDVRAGRYLGGASKVMQSVVQHDVYEALADDDFDASFVGNELEGSPWR